MLVDRPVVFWAGYCAYADTVGDELRSLLNSSNLRIDEAVSVKIEVGDTGCEGGCDKDDEHHQIDHNYFTEGSGSFQSIDLGIVVRNYMRFI